MCAREATEATFCVFTLVFLRLLGASWEIDSDGIICTAFLSSVPGDIYIVTTEHLLTQV